MSSMSPELREMYAKLHSQGAHENASPEPTQANITTPTTASIVTHYSGTEWYNIRAARATPVEVRVLATTYAARLTHV